MFDATTLQRAVRLVFGSSTRFESALRKGSDWLDRLLQIVIC